MFCGVVRGCCLASDSILLFAVVFTQTSPTASKLHERLSNIWRRSTSLTAVLTAMSASLTLLRRCVTLCCLYWRGNLYTYSVYILIS